jgi:aryl-alcohol dehydrogenase-like predicted oxidoreductase
MQPLDARQLGQTDMHVSPIGFGAWAIGGSWGSVDDAESLRALHAAIDAGVNFIDTADVYGDGRSERLIARVKKERPRETVWVATKAGRLLPKQTPEGYSRANLTSWIEASLSRLDVDAIDLLQLHCPHPGVFERPEVFAVLDDLVRAGKIRYYGVSVETVDEAFAALRYPRVQSIQIIFNMFRMKPAERLFRAALERRCAVLARVPLASGLLTGKLTRNAVFEATDHRRFNRHGEMFDVGETFSGVPYEAALDAVDALRGLVSQNPSMAQFALRWILMFEGVTCAIPGAKTALQARENVAAGSAAAIDAVAMNAVREIYESRIKQLVHDRW